ncbi:hypothetical protein QOZ80_5BG0449750 [Eleusine coracana subsp. coracana]|nr:hypothetical protein QOZ80_5BG0449750 [Eleusine coracana subsp. coracana]
MVVSASDPGGQLGVVIEATTSLDLVQIGAEAVVHKNVSPSEVRRVREFNVGDYVLLRRQWLGRVTEVTLDNLEVRVKWIASSTKQQEEASEPPAAWQDNPSEDLTLFSSGNTGWGIGDRCFFPTEPMSVADTRTTAEVLWQEGTRQRHVASTSLVPYGQVLSDIEFFPGNCVVVRGLMDIDLAIDDDDDHDSEGSASSTVDDDADDAAAVPHLCVVRSFDFKDKTARVSVEGHGEIVSSAYDLETAFHDDDVFHGDVVVRLRPPSDEAQACKKADDDDLSWVGRVTDLCDDGRVQVKSCEREIRAIGDDEEISTAVSSEEESHPEPEVDPAELDGFETSCCTDDDVDGGVSAEGKKAANNAAAFGGDESPLFPQFDVVPQSPADHSYIHETNQGVVGGNKWIKRVQKEWKILENSLPDTIYVRAFEDRMDLLRVAIVGATGTPYQDGLFFFDLQLPSSYPAVPPLVEYHSFGLSLNLNIGASGSVCLSLLDTFDGEGVDLWSPAISTILQVVVSIQGLVLMAQPFYTESSNEEHLGTMPFYTAALLYHFRRRGKFVVRACLAYLHEGRCPTEMSSEQQTCSAGFKFAVERFLPRLFQAFTAIGAEGFEQCSTPTAAQ